MAQPNLLVYDADCPYCLGIARVAALSSKIRIEPFQQDGVQDLLEDVFDEPGFTMYLFTEDSVYWGSEAAKEAAAVIGLPGPIRRLIFYCYPYLVKLFTWLTGRRTAQSPDVEDCDVCNIDASTHIGGSKDIDVTASDYLER